MAAKLNEKTIDALLDNLAENEDFRGAFKRNPREATRSLGTNDPAIETLPQEPITDLAPKESFRKSRGVVRKKLMEAMAPFIPITLDIPRS